MEYLVVGLVLLYLITKFSRPIKNSAQAVEYKTYAWSEGVKIEAIEDISKLSVSQETVNKANQNIEIVNSFKLHS